MVKSNRESGLGRYDVVMEPKDMENVAVIMEFKVFDSEDEAELADTAASALKQIEEKNMTQICCKEGYRPKKS